MNDQIMLSVGIDIGTTTTQFTISRLTIKNRMPGGQIPKVEIGDKTVIYRSEIHFTPILSHRKIDGKALKSLLEMEYLRSGIKEDQINTGAVIITGETAKKENAEIIVNLMAELAGDFVVAIAGPVTESILAGKGSGAMDISKQIHGRIINLDIGGGTTNIAVFNDGKIEGDACLAVGGRLLEVNPVDGKLNYVALPAQELAKSKGIFLEEGVESYRSLCNIMVNAVSACVFCEPFSTEGERLMMTPSLTVKNPIYDGILFSGGVAEFIYNDENPENPFLYGDIGPLLAEAFKKSRLFTRIPVMVAKEKIRATVIGAGSYSLEISGSTIFIGWDKLPVKNVPVAKIYLTTKAIEVGEILEKFKRAFFGLGNMNSLNACAIGIILERYPSYQHIKLLAEGLDEAWNHSSQRQVPLIILLEDDFGKVFGQTFLGFTEGKGNFASIDGVKVNDGDYVDIGKPIEGGHSVSLVIKTLVFQSEGRNL